MQHTSEIHLFQAVKYLDAIAHQKELKISEIQTATVPILTYQPTESNIKILIPDLGAITVDNIHIPVHVLYIDQQGQFLVRDERKLLLTNSFQTTKFHNQVSITRGCFIPGDRLLLVQLCRSQLFVS